MQSELFNLTKMSIKHDCTRLPLKKISYVSQSLDSLVCYGDNLKSLELDLCNEHPKSASANDLIKLGALKNLEDLRISLPNSRNVLITHDVISAIYSGCTKLKEIDLGGE